MLKTPLYNFQKQNGARFTEFAGWEMPISFTGIIEEHNAVRGALGIFDVSHMGEILVTGAAAENFLSYVCCNNIQKINAHQAQYSAILNEKGGVIDDLIIYKFSNEKFLLCVNAGNTANDFQWLQQHAKNYAVELNNQSDQYALIAIQGPLARITLTKIFPETLELKYFHFVCSKYKDEEIIIACTGYTGEDGFEVFVPAALAEDFIQSFTEICPDEYKLCGLAARDSLRLEAAYPLHGHELKPDIPAPYSGLSWILKNQQKFIGQAALNDLKQAENYPEKKLCGFKVISLGIVRENTEIINEQGQLIGYSTSGTKTPCCDTPIGLAIIDAKYSQPGNKLQCQVRNKTINLEICPIPFYNK